MRSEDGYALPTVLMISMIIIVIGMGITGAIQGRIKTTLELSHRTDAYLESYSAMNEVIFNILTSTFSPTGMIFLQEKGAEVEWNLYGEQIRLSESVTVRLRDVSGMVSVLFHPVHLRKLMEDISQNSKKSNEFSDALSDWQDRNDLKRLNGAEVFDYRTAGYKYTPRNFYVQTIDELMLVKGFDADIFEQIKEDLVHWGTSVVNFLTMSRKTLKAVLGNDSLAERIVKLRDEGMLTGRVFRDITGIPVTEEFMFMPFGVIKIEVTARVGKAMDRVEAVIVKKQLIRSPYMVLEWKR